MHRDSPSGREWERRFLKTLLYTILYDFSVFGFQIPVSMVFYLFILPLPFTWCYYHLLILFYSSRPSLPSIYYYYLFYFVEEEKRLLYNTLTQKEKIYSLLSSIEKQNKKVKYTEIYRKVPIISSMLYHQQKTMITNNFYILWCHILDPDVVSSLFMPNTLRTDYK